MTIWALTVDTATDVAGEIMEEGALIGVFSSYAKAEAHLDTIDETYTRKKPDYNIEPFTMDVGE